MQRKRRGESIAALLGAGVWSFVLGDLALALVDSIAKRSLSGYAFTYVSMGRRTHLAEVKPFIKGMIGINLALQINTNADNLIVGRLLGASALGFYSIAYQLAMMPVMALSQINLVNFSAMSGLAAPQRTLYMRRALEFYAVLSAPVYGVAFLIAPALIPTIFGQRWIEAVPLFQILLGFAFVRGAMSILGTFLNALDLTNVTARINWMLVPLSLVAFYIGANFGGVIGVAWAVLLVMGMVGALWFWLATARAATLPLSYAWPALPPALGMIAITAAVWLLPMHAYLQATAALIIYCLVLVVRHRPLLAGFAAKLKKQRAAP